MASTLGLHKAYWVIHTDRHTHHNVHTKQVMREVWRDGKIIEQPISERYRISDTEFKQAMDAYNWNEVLGEPENHIREETLK